MNKYVALVASVVLLGACATESIEVVEVELPTEVAEEEICTYSNHYWLFRDYVLLATMVGFGIYFLFF